MDIDHQQLLLHIEVCWLSSGKVLSRLFELRNEVNTFFIQMALPLLISKCLCDYSWLAILAYLADIFAYINALNLSLQGIYVTIFGVEDKIEAMIIKLKVWQHRLSQQNLDAFERRTMIFSRIFSNSK